ncbi:MAG: PIN domain-containing protein [Chloroflexi bacterium]|nr:PIN domain-containing protein [Chloroflexota bacterium]
MTPKNPRVFLDTSVIFAAVLSPTGGARKLFLLGEAGLLQLVVGPTVLNECQDVVQRKAPASLPTLAQLLASASLETSQSPTKKQINAAEAYVQYAPDAHVLAEAILAKPDWFVTHDKEHFLKHRSRIDLSFEIGTPGDVLQRYKDEFIQP